MFFLQFPQKLLTYSISAAPFCFLAYIFLLFFMEIGRQILLGPAFLDIPIGERNSVSPVTHPDESLDGNGGMIFPPRAESIGFVDTFVFILSLSIWVSSHYTTVHFLTGSGLQRY